MIFRTVKSNFFNFGVAALAIVAAVPAHATIVDYTTTGAFTCSGCTVQNNVTVAGTVESIATWGSGANEATLTFIGAQPGGPGGNFIQDDGSGSNGGYGHITASYTGNGAVINGTFTMDINQGPSPATGSATPIVGNLMGLVDDGKTNAFIVIGSQNPSVNIGDVNYELDTVLASKGPAMGDYGIKIVAPTSGHQMGETSLEGTITATPEPTFLSLTGAGFIALAGIALRRRRQNA